MNIDLLGLRNFIQVQLFVAPTVDTPASPIKKKEAVLMAVTLPPKYSPPGLLRRFRTHTLTHSACLSFRP